VDVRLGYEAFGFLDPNETLVLTYTIAATDSAGAVTEHEVTITINGAGSDLQLLASSSDLEFSSALMASTEIDDDSGGEVFVLTETTCRWTMSSSTTGRATSSISRNWGSNWRPGS
jgi:hypothetical protein